MSVNILTFFGRTAAFWSSAGFLTGIVSVAILIKLRSIIEFLSTYLPEQLAASAAIILPLLGLLLSFILTKYIFQSFYQELAAAIEENLPKKLSEGERALENVGHRILARSSHRYY